jgi:hypothetical protein
MTGQHNKRDAKMTETETRRGIDPNVVPAEIDRWNWGAFLLNWIWGIGNHTYIALLTLIPFFGLIMLFVLGAKGSAWAWRNGRWDSVAHFKRVQRLWAIWGAIIWFGVIALVAVMMGGTFYLLRHSEAYELGAATLRTSSEAVNILGAPIATGFPTGTINFDGVSGSATLSFSATGTKTTGRVYVEAIKRNGIWSIKTLTLKPDGSETVIDLMKQMRVETNRSYRRIAAPRAGPAVRLMHLSPV